MPLESFGAFWSPVPRHFVVVVCQHHFVADSCFTFSCPWGPVQLGLKKLRFEHFYKKKFIRNDLALENDILDRCLI